jgi:hypothetical protein
VDRQSRQTRVSHSAQIETRAIGRHFARDAEAATAWAHPIARCVVDGCRAAT